MRGFEGVILDVRSAAEFGAGHIPGALNIGLGGQFASWAGTLIEMGTPIAIAAETREQVDEAVMRLARVGIETVGSFILMAEWPYETAKIEQVTVDKMNEILSVGQEFNCRCPPRGGVYRGSRTRRGNLTLSDLGNVSEEPGSLTADLCLSARRVSFERRDSISRKKIYRAL